jgi:hypothetical protein
VADALSRLDIAHEPLQEAYFTDELRSELYCYAQEDLTPSAFPLSYQVLGENQSKDKQMLKTLQKKDSKYHLKSFQGGGKHRDLIYYNDKIVVPDSQQVRIVDWYHTYLGHPGINRAHHCVRVYLRKLSEKQTQT